MAAENRNRVRSTLGRARTCDLSFRKTTLYPPELRGPTDEFKPLRTGKTIRVESIGQHKYSLEHGRVYIDEFDVNQSMVAAEIRLGDSIFFRPSALRALRYLTE